MTETTSTYLTWTCGACRRPIRIVPEPEQPTRMCRCEKPVRPLRPAETTVTVPDCPLAKRLRAAAPDDELAAALRRNRHVQVTLTGVVQEAWFEGADRRLAMIVRPVGPDGRKEPPVVVRMQAGAVVEVIEEADTA